LKFWIAATVVAIRLFFEPHRREIKNPRKFRLLT